MQIIPTIVHPALMGSFVLLTKCRPSMRIVLSTALHMS